MENEIKISAEVHFLKNESNPKHSIYTFAYTITIENRGTLGATLLSRHWIITDENNHIEEVIGDGVIGKKPHIAAGEVFRYSSGAILKTPVGVMSGSYRMVNDKGEHFNAEIPPFSLLPVSMLH